MPDGFEVDQLVSLAEAGERFVEIADAAAGAHAEFTGAVQRHDGANSGFATTGRLATLAGMWGYQLDDLSKRAATTGGLLQESYGSYEEMEVAVIDSLDRIGSGGGA
ncbi:hypothetical protein [Haloechinothrix sp. LS1_15]|uniref:hypothetical protein n=1 Tax=Haloechinothrix sp. LS1_15 TaxID=2652248 RepID=UPI002947CFD7|nr:hypothetical protein [Haloechinothrix sp. LS1_15]MDV6011832.1 hypothetical protein [Haloechinothrix sp. LS1_15]